MQNTFTHAWTRLVMLTVLAGLFMIALPVSAQAIDVNNDNTSDLIWHNQGSGKVAYWNLNKSTASNYAVGLNAQGLVSTATLNANWSLRTFSDTTFTTLFWHNQGSGKVAYWLVNASDELENQGLVSTQTLNSNWSLRDFYAINGSADNIVWHNQGSGKVAYWQLNRSSNAVGLESQGLVSTATLNQNWSLRDVIDGTGSRTAFYLWHNQGSGKVAYWAINGSNEMEAQGLVSTATLNSNWSLRGYTNTGSNEVIFWHNQGSGKVAFWLVNSSNELLTQGLVSTSTLNSNWAIGGKAD